MSKNKQMIVRLQDAKTYRDENNEYFLELRYLIDDNSTIKELIIPKVELGIPRSYINIESNPGSSFFPELVFAQGNKHKIFTNEECYYMIERVVEEIPTKEMTLEEIEKKMGYKIKIVTKEDLD